MCNGLSKLPYDRFGCDNCGAVTDQSWLMKKSGKQKAQFWGGFYFNYFWPTSNLFLKGATVGGLGSGFDSTVNVSIQNFFKKKIKKISWMLPLLKLLKKNSKVPKTAKTCQKLTPSTNNCQLVVKLSCSQVLKFTSFSSWQVLQFSSWQILKF